MALDIRFYSDAREVLAELGRRRKAAARLPGLIVSDLNMPGMDGIQLARKLRADKAYRDMVVGICTGSENPADHAAASAAGADFVVIKPLDRRTLARICETTGRFELVQEEGGWTRIRQAAA
ncbi:MAG: response regulator [Rhizobiales bacterium]|nr:response regulator [Hyphomicrobiales bacterium]